jgi:hypothetical protein
MLTLYPFADRNSSLRRVVLVVLILVMFLPPMHVILCPLLPTRPDTRCPFVHTAINYELLL